MNELKNFTFEDQQIRALTIEGEPWFVGKDVAEVLGYSNSRKAIADHVDSEDKGVTKCYTLGGTQQIAIINESGLYSLILSSKLPKAKEFKRWVTSEVLPTIRKHGAYMTPAKIEEVLTDPDTIIQLATQLKQEREGRLIAEQRIGELTPKADYCDRVLADKSLVTITQIAKDYGMSGRALNATLHDFGVIYKQGETWFLYAKYQKTGWTHSETIMVDKKDGTQKAVLNTKWTQKGRLGLYELLKAHGILPLIEREG
ncbi:phage antirepressor [Ligilactobacillus ruminis]|jgi:prophage antirepressor-like protein|uniref:Phage antirepressor n=1 Tax=Ligilactobacillus ruminis TaxID=1623 RepID=A0A6A8HC04_9LACO|nr:phage antirepressor [Ligilactobacillus ruminis]MSA19889.1 phage antirepressor [Ligilactobacillus ruminis]MSA21873.1 phage antirepressor [Ligilactobacillus ruminis]MSA23838.1 phage antirepressor [Ligilactobacillus ruminis]MSA34081.1 phage antirepressor [Ligilactobacillus ruminis]MSA40642.1 phage antirepressor [Ligilactobacillus ruminis]